MISVEGLKVEFGAKPLFSNVGFVVNDRDRIALVGKNGAGKSTMLKILCGKQQPTAGVVAIPHGQTVGYLPQVMVLHDDTTVREEAKKAFAHITTLQERVARLQRELAERTDYESEAYIALVERFTLEHERLMMTGAENCDADLERTLSGLGFSRTDFERPTREFSGGWRMRIELAKLLLSRPDVLLLDEPTNHLDIESIQWLEQFLSQSSSSVILVSHDRAFINNVTNRTLEISCGRVTDYRVKYDEYVVLRAERREQQLRAYENQQREIAEMKDFIERFRYKPTKAIQVQSRIKQLEKIVPIEIDEIDTSALRLKFPPCLRSGDFPIICEDMGKTYGAHCVFSNVNLSIRRGEKVAFVGRNGEGKSTLVKCIMREIPFNGCLTIACNTQIGYFAQNQAQMLDENLTVFETIDRVARGEIRMRLNNILGAFMFGGEEADKKVKVLSGGERSRLAMIRLLLEPVNLLILDEPTNHLDMQSKDVLKEAIKAFDGTAIIVSHDREFLDGLVTKVYEFGDGRVKEHIGGVYDWIRSGRADFITRTETSDAKRNPPDGTKRNPSNLSFDIKKSQQSQTTGKEQVIATQEASSTATQLSYQERKEWQKKLRKAQRIVEETEARIEEYEKRLKELDAILCQPENAANMELIGEYTQLKGALDKDVERWETAIDELEKIKNKNE